MALLCRRVDVFERHFAEGHRAPGDPSSRCTKKAGDEFNVQGKRGVEQAKVSCSDEVVALVGNVKATVPHGSIDFDVSTAPRGASAACWSSACEGPVDVDGVRQNRLSVGVCSVTDVRDAVGCVAGDVVKGGGDIGLSQQLSDVELGFIHPFVSNPVRGDVHNRGTP